MQVKALVILLLVGGSLFVASSRAAQRVSVHASPSVSFAPADLSIRATVEANEDNRSVEITAESMSFYRSSEVTLFGERGPRTTLLRLGSVPGGYYEVRAIVKGTNGEELASARTVVRVLDHADVR
ncbi:MAG: hypothetical protein AB7Q29_15420 [Vicinamibacterales bacterium]